MQATPTLLRDCLIRFFCIAISAVIVLTGSSGLARAAEAEYPADWFFSGMEKMRSSLEGGPSIELSTDTWIGDETTLEQSIGKVVVLDFWATWCGPCVASIPKNIAMVEQYKDDLVFIGVHSATSGWDKAPAMVEDRDINYPVVLDTGETGDAYKINAFPTYIIIDRSGIVRAAGVKPAHVKDIVQRLIDESGSSAPKRSFATFDRRWFYGGVERMTPWQEQLGEPARPLLARAWWTPNDLDANEADEDDPVEEVAEEAELLADAPEGLSDEDVSNSVRVLHFTRPGMTIAQKQLKKLNATAEKYAAQGVVFTAVCDHESNWEATRTFATENKIAFPIAHDAANAAVATNQDGTEVKAREAGRTARGYHVRFAPVTVVIDRQGRIRATGLKLEKLSEALEVLLSESAG
ncbi:MAG: hypothetical protein Aurels2KO_06320 [Aureliella sp.]